MLERLAECIYRHRTDDNKPILLLGRVCSGGSSASPEGYWFLAELIKKGYFDLVLTTCSDKCLEKILARTMDYDDFKVIVRGEVGDETVDTIIREIRLPRIKIVKLRGDYGAADKSIESSTEWEIQEPLKENLYRIIRERGIVFVGNSRIDNSLFRDFPGHENQKDWYIDVKGPNSISITHNQPGPSVYGEGDIVPGDEGRFDGFLISLAKSILAKEQEESEVLSQLQEALSKSEDIGEQSSICKVEVDRRRLNAKIKKLKDEIQKRFPGFKNLVFINDPDAPGGIRILERFKSIFADWMAAKTSYKLKVSGRGDDADDRTAERFSDENDNEVDADAIHVSGRKFLLIDSVSFSGGTIEKAKDKLIEIFGEKTEISAAVIYTGPDLERKLKEPGFYFKEANFFRIKELNSYQILFPWGWISSTVPICTNRKRRNHREIFNEFIPDRHFDLLPRPWGSVFSMVQNENVSVKILYLNPGEALSLHKHNIRDELFLVLDKYVELQIWDKRIRLERGNSFRVPAGTRHRLIGLKVPCRVLEISRNYYSQVEDIERYGDKYGRVGKKGDE